jgi:spore coat protein U-like protein
VVTLAVVTAIAPSTVSAAPALSFGTVSVGAVKTLSTTVPLEAALSDLPAGTVLYSGGNSSIDLGLAVAGLSVPLTNTEIINEIGDISATYHLTGSLATGTDFDLDAPTCATGTVSCSASVTFSPTASGARIDTLTWQMSDIDLTGGGTLGSLLQLLAPFLAASFADQLAISLDGIGVPSSDSVNAQVDIAASAACIELSTSSVDFGSSTLGAEDLPATPTITVTNCSGVGETLYARGTDASGPSSAWSLVDSAATCATDLGLDNYRLGLGLEDLSVVGLSTLNKTLQSLAPGEDADQVARIWTACPGSTGAGVVMTMQIHYLVVGE